MSKISQFLAAVLIATAIALGPAVVLTSTDAEAASSDNNSKSSSKADYFDLGQKAFENNDWKDAVKNFKKAVAEDSENAEAYNLMGYSYRRMGKADSAFSAYAKALDIDPDHLGAHEYLGETYLLVGDAEKAHGQLAILTDLCGKQCEETVKLREAIKQHEANTNDQLSLILDREDW